VKAVIALFFMLLTHAIVSSLCTAPLTNTCNINLKNTGNTGHARSPAFEVVNGVGRGMGVLDRVHMSQGEGEVLGGFVLIGFNGIFLTEMYLTRCWNML